MRLILVLEASLTVALASYGNAVAASPGYGAPPPVAGPYQAPTQQAPQYPAPYAYSFMYGSSSTSSSSSSSESSSGSSESNERPPKRDTCTNNLTSWEECPKLFQQMETEYRKNVCTKPTMRSIRLRDIKERLSIVCPTSDKEEEMVMVVNGPSFIAMGTGTQEAIVTCHARDVWSALGGLEPGIQEKVFFTNVWCMREVQKNPEGRRRRHVNETSGSDDLPRRVNTMNLSTMQEQQTTASSVESTVASESTGTTTTSST